MVTGTRKHKNTPTYFFFFSMHAAVFEMTRVGGAQCSSMIGSTTADEGKRPHRWSGGKWGRNGRGEQRETSCTIARMRIGPTNRRGGRRHSSCINMHIQASCDRLPLLPYSLSSSSSTSSVFQRYSSHDAHSPVTMLAAK